VLFFVLHWIKLVPGILFPDQACFLQLFLTVVSDRAYFSGSLRFFHNNLVFFRIFIVFALFSSTHSAFFQFFSRI